MSAISVIVQSQENHEETKQAVAFLLDSPLIKTIFVSAGSFYSQPDSSKCVMIQPSVLESGMAFNSLLYKVDTPWLLIIPDTRGLDIPSSSIDRLLDVAEITGAGLVYADFRERSVDGRYSEHPLIDYQMGSIRDTFDFGPLMLCSLSAIREALNTWGPIASLESAGLYDLRLKLSLTSSFFHLQEFLCTKKETDSRSSGEKIFDYVRLDQHKIQKEMETVATAHLQRIGAYLPPSFAKVPQSSHNFPLEASVIIPVRNRRRTVMEAVDSALSQKADFPFNVIVMDNFSTDGTTELLSERAKRSPNLHHRIPGRHDLDIGGCWNEAVWDHACGRYAVQLDSDDLYSRDDALQQMVNLLRSGRYAMAIGAYTLVNERLEEIPPGLIDHREWTPGNGRNNALRINGLGAPRAFSTELVRKTGFLNVGYGEDYALALRLSRHYEIGRIYESLYLCRRWTDNTDASLSIEKSNRNDFFKDRIRTLEILARQKENRNRP